MNKRKGERRKKRKSEESKKEKVVILTRKREIFNTKKGNNCLVSPFRVVASILLLFAFSP